ARVQSLAARVADFHASLQRATDRLAALPEMREFLSAAPAERERMRPRMNEVLLAYAATDRRLRRQAIFAPDGTVLATTEPPLLGRNYSFRRYFKDAIAGLHASEEVYVAVPEVESVPSIAYVAPVRAGNSVVGLAVLFARAAALWDLVETANTTA